MGTVTNVNGVTYGDTGGTFTAEVRIDKRIPIPDVPRSNGKVPVWSRTVEAMSPGDSVGGLDKSRANNLSAFINGRYGKGASTIRRMDSEGGTYRVWMLRNVKG